MPNAFLLTRGWHDTSQGVVLDFWWATDTGPLWTQITQQDVVFFVAQKDHENIQQCLSSLTDWQQKALALKTCDKIPVAGLYFKRSRIAREAKTLLDNEGISYWEADIRPPERYLMERFITAAAAVQAPSPIAHRRPNPVQNPPIAPADFKPTLNMVSLDIETSMDARELYSIAVYTEHVRYVFMVSDSNTSTPLSEQATLQYCVSEKQCLLEFLAWLHRNDPDIIIGWSVVQFDLWVLQKMADRLGVPLTLGRAKKTCYWREESGDRQRRFASIPGRVALDGIELLKAANYLFDSYSLQNISATLLGEGKLLQGNDRGGDITQLFHNDKVSLAHYNLKDCELVWEIFKQKELLDFTLERSQLTGLLLDRIGGSVAAFEYSYLPRLHRQGFVAPNLGELESDIISPGGFVMDSKPGIYNHVLVLDFKSLYPSIIRTFFIDPCAYWIARDDSEGEEGNQVLGFNGAVFSTEHAILPDVIKNLWEARDIAKSHKNSPLSHAIKIIMNSFYGVLGSTGCRFYDPRVCSSITLRGHEILQATKEWIEQQGYQVIYGDTDSVFVWLESAEHAKALDGAAANGIGTKLAEGLNHWWREKLKKEHEIESRLEIEFETHYEKFLMPTVRGSEVGSKKRYAGLVRYGNKTEMVFKGLENVRTDWTPLAKDFQLELYTRVFAESEYRDFVRETVSDLMQGARDSALIYRKRLRRNLDDYQKNTPPHVQAARKCFEWTGKKARRGDWIAYVITINGAEPVEAQKSALNYQHYLDKQLAPITDAILYFLDDSLAAIVEQQISLFGGS